MDRVLAVSRTEGCESHSTARTGGAAYRAVGGGRHVAGDFKILQRGSREEFSALLGNFHTDGDRCLELLDACDALDPEALDELANAVTGHIVNEIDCGDEWATFMLGFLFHLKNQQKNLVTNQRRSFDVLLVKVNEFNARHDEVRAFVGRQELHEEVERRRQALEAETERVIQGINERVERVVQAEREETERVRQEGLAEVERVQQEEEAKTEQLRVEAAQRRLADDAETERLQQEGLAELELLRSRKPVGFREMASRIPIIGWFFRKSENAPAGQDQANPGDVNFS
jgi:hypothetical protein